MWQEWLLWTVIFGGGMCLWDVYVKRQRWTVWLVSVSFAGAAVGMGVYLWTRPLVYSLLGL